jgi:hypothetical protein
VPAQDSIHDAVVAALRKEGWTITDDPLTLDFEEYFLYVDLGGERAVGATRGSEQIAIEIKSFVSRSEVADLQQAVGQYIVYRSFLRATDPERQLYLAVSAEVHDRVFTKRAVQWVVDELNIAIVVIDVDSEEVVLWER